MTTINSRLRENARVQLEGKWGKAWLFGFLYSLRALIPLMIILLLKKHFFISIVLAAIIFLLITGPLTVGANFYSLKLKRAEDPSVAAVFMGFKYWRAALALYLWTLLWVLLWSLPLIFMGFIKSISYSMCFYILADNPQIGVRKALKISKRITKGFKGKIFAFNLCFAGWMILAIMSLGIGFWWLIPYKRISSANLYEEIKNASIEKFVCTVEEYTQKTN